MKLPIIGQAVGTGDPVTARAAVNVLFEQRPQGEKALFVARPLPKIDKQFSLVYADYVDYCDDGFCWAADANVGVGPYQIKRWIPYDATITPTVVGSITGGSRWPRFAHGHGGMLIANGGGNYYHSSNGTSIATKAFAGGETAIDVVYDHGWYLLLGNRSLYWVDDPSVAVSALDFVGVDVSADKNVGIISTGPAIAIFGERTIQFFTVSDNPDRPFQPLVEATLSYGVSNRGCIKKIGGTIYFWGYETSGTSGLFALTGMRVQRVSTPDMERAFLDGNYLDHISVGVDGFEWNGRHIVHISKALGTTSWMLDVSTGALTEIPENSPYFWTHWFFSAQGFIFAGTRTGMYILRVEQTDPAVQRSITTDHVVSGELDKFTIDRLRCDCGGMQSLTLEVSRDGGQTWKAPMQAQVGGKRQVQFNRLGTARQFTFRLSWTGDGVLSNVMPAGA